MENTDQLDVSLKTDEETKGLSEENIENNLNYALELRKIKIAWFKAISAVSLVALGGTGTYLTVNRHEQNRKTKQLQLLTQKQNTELKLAEKKHNAEMRTELLNTYLSGEKDQIQKRITVLNFIEKLDDPDGLKAFVEVERAHRQDEKKSREELENAKFEAREARVNATKATEYAHELEERVKQLIRNSKNRSEKIIEEAKQKAQDAKEKAKKAEADKKRAEQELEKRRREEKLSKCKPEYRYSKDRGLIQTKKCK